MNTPTVHVHYVDGTVAEGTADEWASMRADGVCHVVITNASGSVRFGGHSAYWLYRENDQWAAGMAAFAYAPVLPSETLFLADGRQDSRRIEYVPDLAHSAIKLGWWRPGEGRP